MSDGAQSYPPKTRPDPTPWATPRASLLNRLDEVNPGGIGIVRGWPGYGKTTTLSMWYASLPRGTDVTWLTVRPEHSDADLLAVDLDAASHRHSERGRPRGLERVLADIAWRATRSRESTVLMLDDLDRAQDPAVEDAFDEFLAHRPAGLAVVFSARGSRGLHARSKHAWEVVCELTTADLAFDRDEAQRFLRRRFALDISRSGTVNYAAIEQAIDRCRVGG